MNSLHITLQNDDPYTMLSSMPEDVETLDDSVRLTSSRAPTRGKQSPHQPHALEESWNGLFLSSSSSDLATPEAAVVPSNKKLGHASFTDFGLTARHHPRQHACKLTEQDLQAAKSQLMKMRLERLLNSSRTTNTLRTNNQSSTHPDQDRLHQSDSALLRKTSDTDTTALDGAWYKAKHPGRRGSTSSWVEQLTQSAPAGSLDL